MNPIVLPEEPETDHPPIIPLTVRRMRGGGIGLFVGNEALAGLRAVNISDDGTMSVLTVQFDCAEVQFDTERADTTNMN